MAIALSYYWLVQPIDLDIHTLSVANAQSQTAGRIAFVSDRDGNDEIYAMNTDGSNVTRLTHNPAKDWWPRWSPDGQQIAYSSDRDGDFEIYVMNADGSNVNRLTYDSAGDWLPSWSPDGRHISFASRRDGDFEIYVMNADGSQVTQLTQNQVNDWSPDWSPDGLRIAFMSDRDGNNDIYVMDAHGSATTRLTHDTNSDSRPTWSPVSQRIAFASNRDGDYDIYVMNSDGTGISRLTVNAWDDQFPTWSKDGQHIAFSSNRDGNEEIYVMNADGTGQWNATSNPASDGSTDWGLGPAEPVSHESPVLVVSPGAHDFGRVTQGETPGIILSIYNAGTGVLHWGYRSMPDWVDIESPGDLSETGEGTILLRVRSDAPLGNLSGTFEISSNGGEVPITLSAEVVPLSRPDLVVEGATVDGVSGPTQFTVGDSVNIHAWVTNIGEGTPGVSGILYQIGDPSDWFWWSIDTLLPLHPGETSEVSIAYTFTDEDAGSQYFRIMADYDSEIDELDESNNVAVIGPFQVVPAPVPVPTPMNTPTPTSASTPTGTPAAKPVPTNTPTPTPGPDGPIVTLHAESSEAVSGQEVNVSLTVRNVASNPDMTIDVIIEAPQGLLLRGESCSSSGQCSSTSHLTGDGGTGQIDLTATASKSGPYTLEAIVSWSIPNRGSATISRSLELTFTDLIVVDLHADRTDIAVGEPVVLTFEATNSIANPPATGKLSLTRPSGWSVSEAEFADSCAASCVGNLSIPSGQPKSIVVKMVPNQPGTFPIEANLEWVLQDDSNRAGTAADSVDITVAATEIQPSGTSVAASGSTAGQRPEDSGPPTGDDQASPWWLSPLALVGLVLLAIVVIVAIGSLAIVRSIWAARPEPQVLNVDRFDLTPGNSISGKESPPGKIGDGRRTDGTEEVH